MVGEHKPTPRDNQRKERVATIALCFIRGRTRVQREEDRSPCTNHAHAESHRGLPRNTRVRYASFTRVKETAGSASRTLTEFESDWYWLDQIVVGVFILISSQYVCSTALFETWTIAMWGPDHLYISLWIASSTLIGPRESYAFCPSWWQKWLSHHHQHLQSAEDFSQLQLDNDIRDKISQPQTVLLQSC